MKILAFLLILISLSAAAYSQDSTGTIVVTIEGFRSDKGEARATLFNSSEGYPNKSEKAFKSDSAKIVDGQARIIFVNIPIGTSAVGVIHDENSNGKLDTNILGMPREGMGASNNAKGHFGPPKFDDAKFELKSDTLVLKIKMKYLGR